MDWYQPSFFLWVSGSPSAAENPPHDRRWRDAIATETRRDTPFGARQVGLDFLLEPRRRQIDIDNLVRLAIDGLRDAQAISKAPGELLSIVATKRVGPPYGVGISLIGDVGSRTDGTLHEHVDVTIGSDVIPRGDRVDEKRAWRAAVTAAHSELPGTGPVAVDIRVRSSYSLIAMLKPVIDGLEGYLGRGIAGGREFTPLDDRIVLLRARRDMDMPAALQVTCGPPAVGNAYRAGPRQPTTPQMDPNWSYSTDDLEGLERRDAWLRIFADGLDKA